MKCDKCNGSGNIPDHKKVGADLRLKRKRARVSLRAIARRLQFSPAYISDLELGRRNWTEQLKLGYELALSLEVKK
jgi:transcriptional regulator with XRE-family HTH domain